MPAKRTQDGFISWKQRASCCAFKSSASEAVPDRPVPSPMTITIGTPTPGEAILWDAGRGSPQNAFSLHIVALTRAQARPNDAVNSGVNQFDLVFSWRNWPITQGAICPIV